MLPSTGFGVYGALRARLRVLTGVFLLLSSAVSFPPSLSSQEVLSARISVDSEPMWARALGFKYPLNNEDLVALAREEARMIFTAMVYGWSYEWIPGNTARGIKEEIILEPFGKVDGNEPALRLVSSWREDTILILSVEYTAVAHEERRFKAWQAASYRSVQGRGQAGLSSSADAKWAAVEEAARSAVMALVKTRERNRPRRVFGTIALASPPRIWIASGQWQVQARFRVAIDRVEGQAVW